MERANLSDWRHVLTDPQPKLRTRVLRWALRLASLPYGLVMLGRNAAYDWKWLKATHSPLVTISIGNLSVGGTGKSPMVAWLARWLRDRHIRVAVLSRGYGQLDSGLNDEALEFELRFPDVPHLQHADRVASAKLAEEELEMQVLLLDDGFQHRRLARELDIVLLDATHPTTALRLLPAGLMREPLSSLSRAAVVVLTRADQVSGEQLSKLEGQLVRYAPQATRVTARHRPASLFVHPEQQRDIQMLHGMDVLAFCAIGNPESFFRSLTELGANVLDRRTWPDHHAFTAEELSHCEAWCQAYPTARMVVCTMKDWVKIQESRLGGVELAALQIEMELISGRAELENRLELLLQQIDKP